ncbi:hypothetical protein HALLA_03750 (plasmid) [Halostagnicola larsenii XH-48]|uniref:DUF4177 domain-containing protein n=2 Tax=Halostagnicola larsenii TaxID=353800 RepID=W0JW18_9EURY|nr:hypothetical protein HALLA_03750 [Halostagnicola larsenii XH-48]
MSECLRGALLSVQADHIPYQECSHYLGGGAEYRGLQYLLVVMAESEVTCWEYETFRPPRDETQKEAEDPKAELNQLGAEGWEFVETIAYEGGGTKYLVFKRPVQSGEPV